MIRISVDNEATNLGPNHYAKVGECLEAVLSTLPPNRVVTDILLDGTHLAKHERMNVLEDKIDSIEEMSVMTADTQIWVENGIDMALSRIKRIKQSLIPAAELFRSDDKANANRFFARCIDGLQRFIETIMITRGALKLDFNMIKFDGISLADLERALNQILKNILEAQQRQDFEEIADRIECELLTNLYSWAKALDQFHHKLKQL